ncbi:MAG: type II toxin-antitoxin system RelE family toxin [Flammeovirgaceae bacterium]|jgi:mRNA interferase RelE/StbE
MIVSFDRSFQKSLDKISDPLVARQIEKLIQKIITISSIRQLPQAKKLQGFSNYYRIRIGNYRVGCELTTPSEILFVIVANRKDIYKYFP